MTPGAGPDRVGAADVGRTVSRRSATRDGHRAGRSVVRSALALVGAAAVTVVLDRLLEGPVAAAQPPGWRRTNFRGRPVSLSGGASAVGGALAGLTQADPPWRRAAAIAAGAAALAGAYDDLVSTRVEQPGDKGWRGHVRAARAGRLSGGAVKVIMIGTGSLLAAGTARSTDPATPPARMALLDAALIAGSANLLNLFDLRPGRAGKVALLVATAGLRGPAAMVSAATAGAAVAALPRDLHESRMLGDLGSNALGALIGVRLCTARPRRRAAAVLVVAGLTAASERISFSRVIDSVPALRTLDRWGRTTP